MKSIRTIAFLAAVLVPLTGPPGLIGQDSGRPRTLGSPTPAPTLVAPTGSAAAISPSAALPELQSKIRARLSRPDVRRGRIGIKAVSLSTGRVLYEENAEQYFMPASNMKNFTVAAALERLTPDFRFITTVLAPQKPAADGTVTGDLTIVGRGDVSFAAAFNGGDYFKALDALADKIVAAGVKRVTGGLIGDESYFRGSPLPMGWEWDDLQWYYGAEVSALPINDNVIEVSISPGPVGYPCTVRIGPFNPVVRITNLCTTGRAGSRRTLGVNKTLGQNALTITGSLPAGDGFSEPIAVSHPAEMFISLLKQRLEAKGLSFGGRARVTDQEPNPADAPLVEITRSESVSLSQIAARTMKVSQNMYTETLLWTLGEEMRRRNPAGSSPDAFRQDSSVLGLGEMRTFLGGIGIPSDGIVQYDGSGLSRHNLVTPAAVTRLYTYMGKESRYSSAWRETLTIGGVDGTLRNRFKGTRAAGNIRGKTGTLDQVSALSGYLTTAAGEQIVVSIIVNGVVDPPTRVGLINDVVVYLADFSGKVD